MYEIVNIIKLEQLREYLNQRGVNQGLLQNPRFYEVLEFITIEIPFISIDNSSKSRLDKKIDIDNEGNIKIVTNPFSDISKFYSTKKGITFEYQKLHDGILTKKNRNFNYSGIEINQGTKIASIHEGEFGNDKIEYIPNESQEIYRDKERPDIIILKYQKDRGILKNKFIMRKKFIEFENLSISENNKKRFHIRNQDAYFITEAKNDYHIMKKLITTDYEKAIQEYKMYNRVYGFSSRYEKGIEALCFRNKIIRGGD